MVIITISIIIMIYFLPSLVAGSRWSINTTLIFFLNLFLAWMVLPWFFLFFMAIGKTKKDVKREDAILEALQNNYEKRTGCN